MENIYLNHLIGTKIKERRLKLNLTQQQLAKEVGYTDRSSIAKIEKGLVDLPQSKIAELARALKTSPTQLISIPNPYSKQKEKGITINILGKVQAGIPIEMIEDIIGEEEINPEMAKTGVYFGLIIRGNSMAPNFIENDIAIVRQQDTIESGEIAIVCVNGEDATVKKVKFTDNGLMLIPFNPDYETMFFTKEEIKNKPITIIGKVVEIRRKL